MWAVAISDSQLLNRQLFLLFCLLHKLHYISCSSSLHLTWCHGSWEDGSFRLRSVKHRGHLWIHRWLHLWIHRWLHSWIQRGLHLWIIIWLTYLWISHRRHHLRNRNWNRDSLYSDFRWCSLRYSHWIRNLFDQWRTWYRIRYGYWYMFDDRWLSDWNRHWVGYIAYLWYRECVTYPW